MKDNAIENYLLYKESLFWIPDYLETSAWIEHIPFAFWIIEVVKPKKVVELGVHSGVSYFSFCQAVKTLNLDSACYGIDTWKGDEHAGFYEENIFARVTSHNLQKYSRFSTLIRSTFDEASNYFIDGSVDLLHIDGLHTYEAVKHDFEKWLPKLSPDAIVIFHDINVRERNFGVFKFWEELKTTYGRIQFDFGHGLGIIALSDGIPEELKMLFDKKETPGHFIFLRNFFSEKGNFFKTKFENLTALDNERMSFVTLKNSFMQAEEKHNHLSEEYKSLLAQYQLVKENYASLESKISEHNFIKKSLATQEQKCTELNELFSKILIDNNSLKDQTESLKKDLAWYKATFEERSLAGILKERLKKSFK